jgi:hypothetical protein
MGVGILILGYNREDHWFSRGQAIVQLESSLGRKRKANEMDDEHGFDKVWGIVTDAEKWYFMECTQDVEGKLSFVVEASFCCVR